jgi:hypothetical protein
MISVGGLVCRRAAGDGGERAAEDVIAAAIHRCAFQRPEIGNRFDHANDLVTVWRGTDGAGIPAVQIAAGSAGFHRIGGGADGIRQRQQTGFAFA